MSINLTLIGQMITFAVLVWFTMKYVWPPVTQALNERQKKVANGIAAAAQGQQELINARQEGTNIVDVAKQQASGIVDQANKQANKVVDDAKSAAQEEGRRIIQAADAEAEQAYHQAKDELREHVVALALASAEKILGQSVADKGHEAMLDKLLTDVQDDKSELAAR